ncbi:N-acetylglucosamine kinase [Lutispora sp.]|uniref:N-acetylglucosamine kinase n=1 Tax=Lutispora sp. TaxID=2828727 RepID=UPI00356904F4
MKIYIGIDGGGTNLKALIGDEKKRVIGAIKCGPANYYSIGVDRVKESFNNLLHYCKNEYKITYENIKCICMGCAGINNKRDEMIYKNIMNELGYCNKLLIYNDAYVALVGANRKIEGAVLLSGTGSIAYGISKDGTHVHVGGWGHIIGDEGSGYSIARDALNAVARSIDGIIPNTSLTIAIMDKLCINSLEELMAYIYDPKTQKHHIAELAPIVLKMANSDNIANDIVKNAAHNLCNMVYALSKKMNLDRFPLALSGSILTKSEVIRNIIIAELKHSTPEIHVTMGDREPDYGALLLAWKEGLLHNE